MSDPFNRMMDKLDGITLMLGAIKRDSWTWLHALLVVVAFASIRTCTAVEEMNERSKPEPKAMEPKQ